MNRDAQLHHHQGSRKMVPLLLLQVALKYGANGQDASQSLSPIPSIQAYLDHFLFLSLLELLDIDITLWRSFNTPYEPECVDSVIKYVEFTSPLNDLSSIRSISPRGPPT